MIIYKKIENLNCNIPENKFDIIIDNSEINNSLLSEPSLAKDWLLKEEDNSWQHL